eukprot:1426501-Rhodomonas_salina.4
MRLPCLHLQNRVTPSHSDHLGANFLDKSSSQGIRAQRTGSTEGDFSFESERVCPELWKYVYLTRYEHRRNPQSKLFSHQKEVT